MKKRSIENPNNFLAPYVYFGDVFEVENGYGETVFIPFSEFDPDLVDCYHHSSPGETKSTLVVGVYYGRLSADGYLDCTDWVIGDSEEEVLNELESLYGEDYPGQQKGNDTNAITSN